MASIVLRRFGGMAPSANLKGMDEDIASFSKNLTHRFGDFRPMPLPNNLGSATAGGTLYRFETFGTFITKVGNVNFVRGPIPTDVLERTYYTGDGAPKVTDSSAAVRQLGVPKPAAAPTLVVNAVAQYGERDALAAQGTKLAEFSAAILANCTNPYIGLTDGEITGGLVVGDALWSFHFQMAGSMSGGAFVPTNANHQNLMSSDLGFYLRSGPVGIVDVNLRGQEFVLGAGIAAALQAINDPSDLTNTRKLITSDQATAVVNELTTSLNAANVARDATKGRILLLKNEFVDLANNGSAATEGKIGVMAAFYARSDVQASIDDALNQAASAIANALDSYNIPHGYLFP